MNRHANHNEQKHKANFAAFMQTFKQVLNSHAVSLFPLRSCYCKYHNWKLCKLTARLWLSGLSE